MRSMRQADRAAAEVGNDVWNEIDDLEKKIITFISGRGRVGRIEIQKYTRKSTKTVNNRLNHLIELGLINTIGNKHDPGRVYEFSKQ